LRSDAARAISLKVPCAFSLGTLMSLSAMLFYHAATGTRLQLLFATHT
jgi:hypothetical protein